MARAITATVGVARALTAAVGVPVPLGGRLVPVAVTVTSRSS